MKRFILFLTAVLFSVAVFSQKRIIILDSLINMSKGKQPAYIVVIPQTKANDIEKAWEKQIRGNFLKQLFKKSKSQEYNKSGNEMVFTHVLIPAVSSDTFNLYTILSENNNEVTMHNFFECKNEFVSDTKSSDLNDEMAKNSFGIKNFMKEFALEQYTNAVKEELKDKERVLKNLEKEYETLLNTVLKKQSFIESAKQKILNANDEILTLDNDISRMGDEVQAKKEEVSSLKKKDKKVYNEAKKDLKSLEKDKRNAQKKQENLRKKIINYEFDIEQAEREIAEKESEKPYKLKEIEEQKVIVKKVEDKLKGIR